MPPTVRDCTTTSVLGLVLAPLPLSTVGILAIVSRVDWPPVTVPTIGYCGAASAAGVKS